MEIMLLIIIIDNFKWVISLLLGPLHNLSPRHVCTVNLEMQLTPSNSHPKKNDSYQFFL